MPTHISDTVASVDASVHSIIVTNHATAANARTANLQTQHTAAEQATKTEASTVQSTSSNQNAEPANKVQGVVPVTKTSPGATVTQGTAEPHVGNKAEAATPNSMVTKNGLNAVFISDKKLPLKEDHERVTNREAKRRSISAFLGEETLGNGHFRASNQETGLQSKATPQMRTAKEPQSTSPSTGQLESCHCRVSLTHSPPRVWCTHDPSAWLSAVSARGDFSVVPARGSQR